MSTQTWARIKDHLERTGRMVNGRTRRARATTCPRCHARVLDGLDAEVCSMVAVVDPHPLDAVGELVAQVEGRRTYALVRDAGRLVLDTRDGGRIKTRPAGAGDYDVLPEHRCGAQLAAPAQPSRLVAPTVTDLPPGSPAPF